MEPVEALAVDDGLVCVVGAGGKKTTLYALANRLDRAVVTATVRIPIFDDEVARVVVTDDPVGAVRSASASRAGAEDGGRTEGEERGEKRVGDGKGGQDGDGEGWPLGIVPERERDDRYRGYDRETVTAIGATPGPEAVLVKADGARTRLLKAPDEREPQVPAAADTVIPVASAKVVGKPLTEAHVHRPERVAALTDLSVGDPVRPLDVATVLASRDGGRKRVPPSATVVPLVNMVDDDDLAATGRAIASELHDCADVKRVVLARMNVPEVVDVVD